MEGLRKQELQEQRIEQDLVCESVSKKLLEYASDKIELISWEGEWEGLIPTFYTQTGITPNPTSADSTRMFIEDHDPDLFLYAGEMNTRDIVQALVIGMFR